MRKLILISAFVLASVSAQAGQARNLIVASNEEPAVAKVETTKPETAKAAEAQPAATKAETTTAKPNAQAETSKPQASKSAKKSHVKGYEADEAKARRIAAKYGISW